ncbi:MAG TPA: hypothetical protein VKT28_13800 [Puia sp.]|nr:hypothetical protein [Puia sp.]
MSFDKYELRKEIIKLLKLADGHFADISDVVNEHAKGDNGNKKEVERELVHLVRNMQVLDIKEREKGSNELNDDWLEIFKKTNLQAGEKIEGLYASFTKEYLASIRQKRLYYIGFAILIVVLIIWASQKL